MRSLLAFCVTFIGFKGLLLYFQGEKQENLFDWSNFWVLGPAFIFLWGLREFVSRSERKTPLQLAMILWFSTLMVHTYFNFAYFGIALAILSYLPWGAFIGLGLWGSLEKKYRLDFFLAALIQFIAAGFAISVIYEFATGDILLRASNRIETQNVFRYSGITGSPVSTGLAITCGMFGAVYVWTQTKAIWVKVLTVVSAGLYVIGSVLCLGRLSLLLGIIGLAIQARTLFRQSLGLITMASVSIVILTTVAGQFLADNNSTQYFLQALAFDEGGNVSRLQIYGEQIQIITATTKDFLFGTGAGSTEWLAEEVYGEEETTESSALRLLREFGVIGSIPFVAIVGLTMATLLRATRRPAYRVTATVFATLFAIVTIQSMFAETLDGWYNSFLFWAGIAVAGQLEQAMTAERARQAEAPEAEDAEDTVLSMGQPELT